MAKKTDNPISIKFILFVFIMLGAIIYYISIPNDIEKINQSKTFEEMLEYNKGDVSTNIDMLENDQKYTNTAQSNYTNRDTQKKKTKSYKKERNNSSSINNFDYNKAFNQAKITKKADTRINKTDETYDKLLDELKQYPPRSLNSVESIIKKILVYKGFYANTVKVVTEEADEAHSQAQSSYIAAYFNIQTGNVHVNEKALSELSIPVIVAILAHELDHFEKIAQLCKSMGVQNFIQLAKDNKMANVNEEFWTRACQRANLTNYNAQYYKEAFVRYLSQGTIDLASTYADLYRLSEHMRNPLEISAYEVSDYALNHFNVSNEDGPLKKLIIQFNKVDWAIYNFTSQNKILNDQRIAFFDYFFIHAIINTHPKYRDAYLDCINNKNGDMTSFWLQFEHDNISLYSKNKQIDKRTYENIMLLLKRTEALAKTNINNDIVTNALKYKVMTLLSNIVYPNALKNIKSAASDYLQYSKEQNVISPRTELQMILTLICMENDFYKNNGVKIGSLFYIKMPPVIENLYSIDQKARRFYFIYRNPAFIAELNHRKANNKFYTEQILLKDLLEESKPIIKFKY